MRIRCALLPALSTILRAKLWPGSIQCKQSPLTDRTAPAQGASMTRTALAIVLGAAAALAGCNKQDHTIQSGPADPMANDISNAAPVELPPAIAHSKIYRCKTTRRLYDWLDDNKSAISGRQNAPPTL